MMKKLFLALLTAALLFAVPAHGVTVNSCSFSEPGADRLLFWDESADDCGAATPGTGLSTSGTTLNVSLAPFNTNNLVEGTTNLYFSNERVDDRAAELIQNGTGLTWTYDDAGNTLTGNVSLTPFSTTNLAEGINLYYTTDRVNTDAPNVTLSGENYLSLSGQAITANAVNLSGTNATGTLAAGRFPALTGDVTTTAGSLATTLATVNSNVGTFGSTTQVATPTVNGKGLITAISNTTIEIPSTAVTDFTEAAQDATGAMSTDGSLVYVDSTPLLTRGALTGDISAPQGSNTTTLATVNANVGTFGSSTTVATPTVNAKGLITGVVNTNIQYHSVGTAVSAAGTNLATATALTITAAPTIYEVTTVGSGQGVALPTGNTNRGTVTIINRGANSLLVYPNAAGSTINSLAGGSPFTIPVNSSSTFAAKSTTAWYSIPAFQNGDVNTSESSSTLTIAANAVTNADFRDSAGLSVIGRAANSTGDPADITAASDNQVLRRSGTSIGFGAINLASSAAVTGDLPLANLAQFGANTVATNATAGTADLSSTSLAGSSVLGRGSSGNITGLTSGGHIAFGAATFDVDVASKYDWTGDHSWNRGFRLYNPAGTFYYDIIRSAIAANRKLTIPLMVADGTMVIDNHTQTLTNKTLTSPVIEGGTIGSTTPATVANVDNLQLDGNTLSSTDTNGNIVIKPNGAGNVVLGASGSANWYVTSGGTLTPAVGTGAYYGVPLDWYAFVANGTAAGMYFNASIGAPGFWFLDLLGGLTGAFDVAGFESYANAPYGIAIGQSTATTLTTNTNDLALLSIAPGSVRRMCASTPVNLTGIVAPSSERTVILILDNVCSNAITLKHLTTSSAANQFRNDNSGDVVLQAQGTAGSRRMLYYDQTDDKWHNIN